MGIAQQALNRFKKGREQMQLTLTVKQQAMLRGVFISPHVLTNIGGVVQYKANTAEERRALAGLRNWFLKMVGEKNIKRDTKNNEILEVDVHSMSYTTTITGTGRDSLRKILEHYQAACSISDLAESYEELMAQMNEKPISIPDFSEEPVKDAKA
jgi:hypothetical protein